jgi:hypothetical protein
MIVVTAVVMTVDVHIVGLVMLVIIVRKVTEENVNC